MRRRGLPDPLLVISDGAPGLIHAVEKCFPRSAAAGASSKSSRVAAPLPNETLDVYDRLRLQRCHSNRHR
jgi:transposase-like protein